MSGVAWPSRVSRRPVPVNPSPTSGTSRRKSLGAAEARIRRRDVGEAGARPAPRGQAAGADLRRVGRHGRERRHLDRQATVSRGQFRADRVSTRDERPLAAVQSRCCAGPDRSPCVSVCDCPALLEPWLRSGSNVSRSVPPDSHSGCLAVTEIELDDGADRCRGRRWPGRAPAGCRARAPAHRARA